MTTTPVKDPLPGEHLVRVEPAMATFVDDAGWRRRPNLFSGRALSADALSADQQQRAGRLALSGQLVAPGVVSGLEVRLERDSKEQAKDPSKARRTLRIGAGSGLAASGEDVQVPRALRVNVDGIPVYVPLDPRGRDVSDFSVERPGKQQKKERPGLYLAVLVLVPVVHQGLPPGDLTDPCEVDVGDEPYLDHTLADGAMLVLFNWPPKVTPPRGGQRRNRLANLIFELERAREPGQMAPWEQIGVPLALLEFDGHGGVAYVDRHAVVRPGGAPRGRTRALPRTGDPLLWQARIQQFAAHVEDLRAAGVADAVLFRHFRKVPPIAPLPRSFVDVLGWTRNLLPVCWTVDAVPVPEDQLDAIVAASAALRPLDTQDPERVRVLVPVPASRWEPKLLHSEFLDPTFLHAIEDGLERLGGWLARRREVRGRMSLVLDAIEGIRGGRFAPLDPAGVDEETQHVPGTAPTNPEEASFGVVRGRVQALFDLLTRYFGDFGRGLSNLPAPLTGAPRAVQTGQTRWEIFAQAKPGKLAHVRYDGAKASVQPLIGSSFGEPAVVALPNGSVQLFVRVKAGGLLFQSGKDNGQGVWQWTTSQPLDAALKRWSSPVALARGAQVDVLAYSNDGDPKKAGIWHFSRDFDGQDPWVKTRLPDTDNYKQKFRLRHFHGLLVSPRPGALWAFVAHPLGFWMRSAHEGGAWGPWTRVLGLAPRNLVALATGTGRVDLFGIAGQAMHHATYQGDVLSPWTRVGGPVVLTPAVVSPQPGSFEAYARGVDGSLMMARHDGGVWSPFMSLGGHLMSEPTVILRGGEPSEVLFRGTGGALWQRQATGSDAWLIAARSGLRGLVRWLRVRNEALDDLLDAKFLAVQTELHRLRQLMLGSVTSSRLATSPALATIVPSSTRTAQNSDVNDYAVRLTRPVWKPLQWDGQQDEPPDRPPLLSRLADAPSRAIWKSARATKYRILRELVDYLRASREEVGTIFVPGLKDAQQQPVHLIQLRDMDEATRTALLKEPTQTEIPGADEGIYFAAGIDLLEGLIAPLRLLEDHVHERERLIAACQAALAGLEGQRDRAGARLRVIDEEVAEGRQDVTVARALLAEELQRIDAINARRAAVLREHVRFLVLQRPRACDLTRDTPTRALDPGVYADVLPEVLASPAAAPPELGAMVELLREAPLKWLTAGRDLLRGLDRIDLVHAALERARTRATLATPPKMPVTPAGRIGEGLQRAFAAQQAVIGGRRQAAGAFDLTSLQARSWADAVEQAAQWTTLGDLIEDSAGRSNVGRAAATELERITRVATGLYARFGEVLPAIRLEWAEQMSQYDAPVQLRELARLPRWGEIEVGERHEMQSLVDWLFQRVVASEPEALALINDLVRVCALLASHAPVDEIVSGHVPRPTVVQIGGTLDLAVAPEKVRIGMHVLVQAAGHTVQAVVEDLSAGAARARVFASTGVSVTIAEKTTVKLTDPGRGKGTLLPRLGVRR